MKRPVRMLAALCAALMMIALLPAPASAHEQLYEYSSQLSGGLYLTETFTSGQARRTYMLDYVPGQGTMPIVAYGGKLYGKSDMNYVTDYTQEQGHTVMAAVNGDYFNMDTGLPTGMLVNGGRLCVSDGGWNAVAFFADGRAMCGTPRLSMQITREDGRVMPISALNKIRTTAGIYLYTDDFAASTHTTAAGREVVLRAEYGGTLRLGQPLSLIVVANNAVAGTAIGEGDFVLSLTNANRAGLSLEDMQPGERITLLARTADPIWHEALYTCGGGNMLARDGALTADATSQADARTVIGVRPDGSLFVLVCDGRQSLSAGISLREAAEMLLAKGCDNVINMDGGGSSALGVRRPGQEECSLVSLPSGGALRKCANFILFAALGDPYMEADSAAVYPHSAAALAGARVELTGKLYNASYYPAGQYDGGFYVESGGGSIDGAAFIAPQEAGRSVVAADDPRLFSHSAQIDTVEEPRSIALVRHGTVSALSALSVQPDGSVDLDVYAFDGLRRLICQDGQFEFSVSGGCGTVDGEGVFTACSVAGMSGSLTVSRGALSLTLPVTVGRAPQMLEDFEGDTVYTASAEEASAQVLRRPEYARCGFGSLALASESEGEVRFEAERALVLPSGVLALSMMVRGSGALSISFGERAEPLAFDGAYDGWQHVSVLVPAGAEAVTGFVTEGFAEVHIDRLMCHFGADPGDTEAPGIELFETDGGIAAVISDNYPLPIGKGLISVTVDGKRAEFEYSDKSGELFCALPEDGGLHRVTVTARDHFYNKSRASLTVGQPEETVFADMDGHWGQVFAEYLRGAGIFSADTRFNPQINVNNAMAATLISRFMGLDTAVYEDTELPYADAGDIPEWALPHVRAAYARGLMIGSVNEYGVSVFRPLGDASRAQIMTILGRTVSRGYGYGSAPFADMDDTPAWARDHIELLHGVGIVSGYGGTDLVKPLNTITRAEMAALLFKMI
ncbi:MAG: phosphodiester glycosidase family protein [Clostridia bacterium]|nr:phosphodiester glycosidase family protein [Clostridia bacterium]